jgi:hypothetical protein
VAREAEVRARKVRIAADREVINRIRYEWLEGNLHHRLATRPYYRAKPHARRCPNLRGPT